MTLSRLSWLTLLSVSVLVGCSNSSDPEVNVTKDATGQKNGADLREVETLEVPEWPPLVSTDYGVQLANLEKATAKFTAAVLDPSMISDSSAGFQLVERTAIGQINHFADLNGYFVKANAQFRQSFSSLTKVLLTELLRIFTDSVETSRQRIAQIDERLRWFKLNDGNSKQIATLESDRVNTSKFIETSDRAVKILAELGTSDLQEANFVVSNRKSFDANPELQKVISSSLQKFNQVHQELQSAYRECLQQLVRDLRQRQQSSRSEHERHVMRVRKLNRQKKLLERVLEKDSTLSISDQERRTLYSLARATKGLSTRLPSDTSEIALKYQLIDRKMPAKEVVSECQRIWRWKEGMPTVSTGFFGGFESRPSAADLQERLDELGRLCSRLEVILELPFEEQLKDFETFIAELDTSEQSAEQ